MAQPENSTRAGEVPPPPGSIDVQVPADSPTGFSTSSSMSAGVAPAPPAPGYRKTLPKPQGKRPRIVVAGIAGAVVLSLLAIALLYYKWYKAEDYTATIIVWAPEAWNEAKVSVTGPNLAAGELTGTLSDKANMLIRFHVPPGEYVVRVIKDGTVVARRASDPRSPLRTNVIWWPFRAPPSATQVVPR